MPSPIYPLVTFPIPTASPISQTLLVAANNAPAGVKAAANYVCDGTADEAEINAALDALPSTGGVVRLSEGTFNLSALVQVTQDSTMLLGAGIGPHNASTQTGRGTMLKAAAGFSDPQILLVQRVADDKPVFGVRISDLTVNGADVAGPIDGLLFRSNMGHVDRCQFNNCTGYGVHVKGYPTWDTYDTRLVNLMCAFNGLAGILMGEDAPDGHVLGCVLQQNRDGIEITAGSIQMLGGQYYGNTRYNIYFNNTGSQSMVNGIKIENAGQHGIFIDTATVGPTGIIISACGFRLNGKSANNTYDHICVAGAQSVPNLVITGNRFSSSPSTDADLPRYGINLSAECQNPTVVGNGFARPTATHFGTGAINYGIGSGSSTPGLVRANQGSKTYGCRGSAAVPSGSTSVTVTHRLAYTPTADELHVTPTNNPTNDIGHWWISAIGATTFQINVESDPGASTATFEWQAG